jgi:hypothetical protein
MTFDERDLNRALAGMRDAVRRQAGPAPAAAALRRRAERQRRVRRAATTLAAAAAVAAVVAGGVTVVRGEAARPPQPAGPTASPAVPPPSATPTPPPPTPEPTSSPRLPTTDPITKVNWGKATIELPAHQGCPSGRVRFTEDRFLPEATGRAGGSDFKVVFEPARVAYGDLTGDGRAEAVLSATCLADGGEGSEDGQGQLLVVQRGDRGRLTGIGWVGQRGAIFSGWWVAQSLLYTDVKPWHVDWGYSLGAARAYRLTGDDFVEVDVTGIYPGLLPAKGRRGAAADLSPVADRIACRDGDLPDRDNVVLSLSAEGLGTAGGTQWHAGQPMAPDSLPHLVDLDGDGRRRLIVALYCGGADAETGPANVVVLERSGRGYRAVTVVVPERGPRMHEWRYAGGVLSLYLGEGAAETRYRWTGSGFVPMDFSPSA